MLPLLLLSTLLSFTYTFDLTIYHTNDIHARYDQRGATEGAKCKDPDGAGCYGGMPRHATFFNDNLNEDANNLILSAGDWFTGTTWFTVYKGNLTAHYLEKFKYDAWAFGNHEFDKGIEVLAETVDKLTYTKPVVANMELKGGSDTELKFDKYIIKEFTNKDQSKTKVGIIGYITPDTGFLSSSGPDVTFTDPVEEVRKVAKDLKDNLKIDIIVALGHAGIDTDKALCENVEELDVVVGGHTNTFLYTGDLPKGPVIKEKVEGTYPLTFRNNKCLVVQAYAYGKYMGNLDVTFDKQGSITSYSGNPVPMWNIAQDSATLTELENFYKKVSGFAKIVVGYATRVVDGTQASCRFKECELGNILADAYLDSFRRNDKNVVCALVNAGGIRSLIEKGDITYEDLLTVQPFGNTVDRADITGAMLKEAFEHSVSTFTAEGDNVGTQGRYLQTAGIKVYYNLTNPVGERVQKLLIQSPSGDRESLVDPTKSYACVGPNFILGGGDKFSMFSPDLDTISGQEDVAILEEFVRAHNPLDSYEGIKDIPSRSFFLISGVREVYCSLWVIVLGLAFISM